MATAGRRTLHPGPPGLRRTHTTLELARGRQWRTLPAVRGRLVMLGFTELLKMYRARGAGGAPFAAVDRVGFRFQTGETLGLAGESGC